jgi:2-(1,2-epoxy-1,2-dihydrophenyl)acetyl-CoA isomerase
MLFGETITAAAAEHIGLVDEVVETDELEVRCGVIARSLVERSPLAAAGVKHLSQIINRTFQDFLAAEMAMQKTLLASDDFKNARDAFLARSSPVFTGR